MARMLARPKKLYMSAKCTKIVRLGINRTQIRPHQASDLISLDISTVDTV